MKNNDRLSDEFSDMHYHDLTHTPSKVYRSHSKFYSTKSCKILVFELNQSGLKPLDITRVVNVVSESGEAYITLR